MKVFCYRNLNRKGVVWSVKDVKSGLVIDRSEKVVLKDVELKVSQAGRARVIKQRRKNVHAGVVGQRMNRAPSGQWVRVVYDPYSMCSFHMQTDYGQFPIERARYAKLTPTGLYVLI
jgi:hypothetical protein